MLKNLITKAKEYATPERIDAIKNGARVGAIAAQAVAERAVASVKERQRLVAEERERAEEERHQKMIAAAKTKELPPLARELLNDQISTVAAKETDDRMRGASLIDLSTASTRDLLRAKTPAGALTFGGVPIDAGDEQQHILLAGAPGTGKSVEIKKALRTIRARRQKAVVYDPSGEFTSLFYRPGKDVLLNPLDQRGARWNPWLDAESFEYAALAKSFVPDRGGETDPFWTESARATFESLMMTCASIDEIVYKGMSAPLPDLALIVKEAGFAGMIGPEKTFQSTRATLAVYLRSLAMLENVRREEVSAFSFRKWLESDETDDSWVFLPVPARARDAIRPLVSMFLDTAVRHIMSLRPDPDRRIWLEIDELPSLQNIPSIHPALAEGRKFGIGAILGVQSFFQLKKSFGDDAAQALWGLPKTRLYLRIADAETTEMISKELGEIQLKRKTESTSEGTSYSDGKSSSNSESSSTSVSEQVVTERLVLPAEIAGLPDLRGYLRTGGSHRVAKVSIEFGGIPRRGDQDDFVWKLQRALPTAESVAADTAKVGDKKEHIVSKDKDARAVQSNPAPAAQDQPAVDTDKARELVIRTRALEMLKESVASWNEQATAELTDEDLSELTKIFIERAEIELAMKLSEPAV
ncbi:type IV secretion system DNA-binding domain-containing protein [Acidithiobacillus thiooxidans]|uniref:type IV secretion system DNA-binding domain-containing protein n=1 Tax=Acidithiobacillus thiooxidans TaxID=930 RepID=UPI0004E195FB|nr:type IV secretion system DNA-binding domain-containing protein [Acidithiobacillus thiooxidans]